MHNAWEAAWVICACVACAFATFMLAFAVLAFGYWTLGLLGLA